jgi:hypothetical protein
MSSGTFSSPFGTNPNPFGGHDGPQSAAASLMHRVIEEDETDNIASPTSPSFGLNNSGTTFRGPFGGGDASIEAPPSALRSPPNPETFPAQYNYARRTSVSAESLQPSTEKNDNWKPPFHEKTAGQLDRLQKAIEDNFLFSHLEEEQSHQILGALVEKPIPAKDIKVSYQPLISQPFSLSTFLGLSSDPHRSFSYSFMEKSMTTNIICTERSLSREMRAISFMWLKRDHSMYMSTLVAASSQGLMAWARRLGPSMRVAPLVS